MISDLQLASAITGVVRVVGWSQDAVLGEIAQSPVIDQRAVDAAIDALASDDGGGSTVSAADAAEPSPAEGKGRERMRTLTRRAKDVADRVDPLTDAAKDLAQPAASAAANVVRGDVYPGHEQWSSVALSQRADWWAQRIGTLIGAVAALPAITGGAAKLVKVTPLMGCAAQSVTVCAVAREGQVDDEAHTVELVAQVVFDRSMDPDDITAAVQAYSMPAKDMIVEDDASSLRRLGAAGRAVQEVRVIRGAMMALRDVDSLLEARPRAGWAVRSMTTIPIAGAAATFVTERAGIHKAAEETVHLLG